MGWLFTYTVKRDGWVEHVLAVKTYSVSRCHLRCCGYCCYQIYHAARQNEQVLILACACCSVVDEWTTKREQTFHRTQMKMHHVDWNDSWTVIRTQDTNVVLSRVASFHHSSGTVVSPVDDNFALVKSEGSHGVLMGDDDHFAVVHWTWRVKLINCTIFFHLLWVWCCLLSCSGILQQCGRCHLGLPLYLFCNQWWVVIWFLRRFLWSGTVLHAVTAHGKSRQCYSTHVL